VLELVEVGPTSDEVEATLDRLLRDKYDVPALVW